MVLGKLPVPGRPTIWGTVGKGPTALAVKPKTTNQPCFLAFLFFCARTIRFCVCFHVTIKAPFQIRGGRVVRRCWVNFQCRGVLLIWVAVGQGPTALAVGAGWGCLDSFYFRLSFLFSFSLSLGDGPI